MSRTAGLGRCIAAALACITGASVASTTDDPMFRLRRTSNFAPPGFDLLQGPLDGGTPALCPPAPDAGWACTWTSDTFKAGQILEPGVTLVSFYLQGAPQPVSPARWAAASSATGFGTTVTVTRPAGVSPGDLLLLVTGADVRYGSPIAGPSGWVNYAYWLVSAGSIVTSMKIAGAAEPPSYSFGLSDAGQWFAAVLQYRDAGQPLFAEGFTAATGTTPTAGVTLTNPYAQALAITTFLGHSNSGWSTPAGATQRVQQTAGGLSFAINEVLMPDAGVLSQTSTLNGATAWVYAGILLLPEAPVCTVPSRAVLGGRTLVSCNFPINAALAGVTSRTCADTSTMAFALDAGERLSFVVTLPADAGCSVAVAFDSPEAASYVALRGLDGGALKDGGASDAGSGDGGISVDAGLAEDAGVSDGGAAIDGGATSDGGAATDGGASERTPVVVELGCGCRSGGPSLGLGLALLVLTRRRVLPRHQASSRPTLHARPADPPPDAHRHDAGPPPPEVPPSAPLPPPAEPPSTGGGTTRKVTSACSDSSAPSLTTKRRRSVPLKPARGR